MEQLGLSVRFKTAVKLSQNDKVEMQVGLLEFELTATQIKALKEFVSRFN